MLPQIPRSDVPCTPISYIDNPYLSAEETAIIVGLVHSVSPRTVIEIGCQRGLTAKCILCHTSGIESYIGVDVPPDHRPTLLDQLSEVPLSAGFLAASDPRFCILIHKDGSLGLTPEDLQPCDAIFIDGDHSERAVRHDAKLARALVRPGGIVIFHDYGNPTVEVTRALDRLHEEGWPIQHIEGTWLAILRMPRPNPPA